MTQSEPTAVPLAEVLRLHEDDLLQRWLIALRECAPASRPSAPGSPDLMKLALRHLIDAVRAIADNRWSTIPIEGPHEHAIHRLSEGLDVRDVVTEYFLLRSVLLDFVWQTRGSDTRAQDVHLVGWAVDAGVREAVGAFAIAREKTLQALAQSRQEALEMLGRVYATAPIGLAAFDLELRFTRVNDRFAEMSGRRPEDHLGHRITEVMPELAQARQLEDGLRSVLEKGEPWLDVPISGETASAPGDVRQWIGSFYPVQRDGKTLRVGAVLQDVTSQKRADEFREHVLGIVSHDFRTPLSVINLSAEVLLQDEELTPRQAKAVARIRTAVGRLDSMVRDLLDLTRSRSGRGLPLERHPVDLAWICAQVDDEIQATHAGRKVELRTSGDLHGEWDPQRLAQAFANLLGNAATYSPEQTPITVRAAADGDFVVVEIENEGPPIRPDILPHIFDPFRREERGHVATGRKAGLGLGLFITREIVRAHGGTITAESDDRRTVFRMRLPRRPG